MFTEITFTIYIFLFILVIVNIENIKILMQMLTECCLKITLNVLNGFSLATKYLTDNLIKAKGKKKIHVKFRK